MRKANRRSKPIPRKSAESDSHQGVPSLGIQSKTTSLIAFTKRFCAPAGEKVKHVFSIDDLAIEILSRLPIESINELKCVCKRWFEVLSHPFFCGAHFQMSQRNLSGLFIQHIYFCYYCQKDFVTEEIDCISFGKDGQIATTANMLDFLPEKVVIIGSCNGILLCRGLFLTSDWYNLCLNFSCDEKISYIPPKEEVVLYVCNPFTKEFTSLKPEGKYYNGCGYGFVCDSSGIINFEVVMIQCPPFRLRKEPYLFTIYSSNTGTWRLSKEVRNSADGLCLHHNCYLNGVFYWLTRNHKILAYDLKQDSSRVINLPEIGYFHLDAVCFGVAEGKLHFINFYLRVFQIWILEYDQWFLKHSKSLYEMDRKILDSRFKEYPPDFEARHCSLFHPQALHGDILFMRFGFRFLSAYNIKTGKVEKDICSCEQLKGPWKQLPVMIPYCKGILQVPSPEKVKKKAEEAGIC